MTTFTTKHQTHDLEGSRENLMGVARKEAEQNFGTNVKVTLLSSTEEFFGDGQGGEITSVWVREGDHSHDTPHNIMSGNNEPLTDATHKPAPAPEPVKTPGSGQPHGGQTTLATPAKPVGVGGSAPTKSPDAGGSVDGMRGSKEVPK